MTDAAMSDDELIAGFLASLDIDQFHTHEKPPPPELNAGIDAEEWNTILWKPACIETPKSELVPIYDRLHTRFPPLYERLILTWRWLDVWMDNARLFSNPPEPSLNTFARQVFKDPVFEEYLIANGYILFGLDDYDPLCFDTNRRLPDGDCIVVKFEHEAMLSHYRIGESWVLWHSCRAMMTERLK
jgi:hypothetical protein